MFVRRLILLGVVMSCGATALLARSIYMGTTSHERALAEARDRLYRVAWSPSVRGNILDRKGRVVARDRASYSIAVEYAVLRGDWARRQARRAAQDAHRDAWPLLSPEERGVLTGRLQPTFDAHVERMWTQLAQIGGVGETELEEAVASRLNRIERLRETIGARRLRDAMIDAVARGRQQTPEMLEEIARRSEVELAEERRHHPVIEDVPDETAFEIAAMVGERSYLLLPTGETVEVPRFPGLEVQRSADRMYPFDQQTVEIDRSAFPLPIRSEEPVRVDVQGVALRVLGWVRAGVQAEDVNRRETALAGLPSLAATATTTALGNRPIDRGRYRPGDVVGRGGVEFARETQLRGLRGVSVERRDTSDRATTTPTPGQDVQLTLDILLQARIRALLEPSVGLAVVQPWHNNQSVEVGTPLNGAAVIIDIPTGDVLAMVSTPSTSRSILETDPQALLDDPQNPLLHRAIGAAYAPGSVAKALILCGATTFGHYTLGERISCPGHLLPGRNDIYRCWIYRDRFGFSTHDAVLGQPPDDIEALGVSCNIFYYTLGRRMGVKTIDRTYRAFGLGERFDFGIGFEHDGRVGAPGMDLGVSDAILMGIGQGPVDWTPLHAADAFATLARMGVRLKPRLYLDEHAPETRSSGMNREAIAHALAGLDRVTNDPQHGTAHAIRFASGRDPIFNVPGIRIIGKTGTATVEMQSADGSPVKRDHAWMVGLAGPEGRPPLYAIAVLLEQGGSGGRASGGLLNQVVHALRAEGYL